MEQILIKVVSSPLNVIDNKVWIYCPVCALAKYEFDITSVHRQVNCGNCRSLISIG